MKSRIQYFIKSTLRFIIPWLIAALGSVDSRAQTGGGTFSTIQLVQDINFYRQKLLAIHPNAALYTTRRALNDFFDSLVKEVRNKPIDGRAFYSLLALSSSKVKDGHTIILPSARSLEDGNSQGVFFPYQVSVSGDSLYVWLRCTPDSSIPEGAGILEVNGMSAKEIIRYLIDRQVRDGNNEAYARWVIHQYFRDYYSFHFGHPGQYTIRFAFQGRESSAIISGRSKDSIVAWRNRSYPQIKFGRQKGEGIRLSVDKSVGLALLAIRDFDSDVLKEEYGQSFAAEINAAFDSLAVGRIDNLVIDLRDNQGGDVGNGVLLLSRLLDRPFRVVNYYQRLSKGKLAQTSGPVNGWQRPVKQPFHGRLFVLINGGSFSNTAIVASCLRENMRAVFIGSDTGGNPDVLAGDANDYELPNTRLQVQIPTRRYVMTALGRNKGGGLAPDYFAGSLLPGSVNDPAIDLVKKLIYR